MESTTTSATELNLSEFIENNTHLTNLEGGGGPPAGFSIGFNFELFRLFTKTSLIIGFCANILALFIIRKCENMKDYNTNEVTGTLLKYLLSIDAIATALFCMRSFFNPIFQTESYFCDLTYTTNLFFSWSTGFINMLLCIERCVALAAPFWYYSHATSWKAHVAAIGCVLSALLLCFLPVFGLGSYRKTKNPYTGTYTCISPSDLSAEGTTSEVFAFAVIFLTVGLGILLVIHVANVIVVVNIINIGRRSKKIGVTFGAISTTESATQSAPGPSAAADDQPVAVLQGKTRQKLINKESRLALVIVALSLVFTLAWLPYYVERSFKAFSEKQTSFELLMASICLLLMNHVLDPFVYVFLKKACRRELFRLLQRILCFWCNIIKTGNTTTTTSGLPPDSGPQD